MSDAVDPPSPEEEGQKPAASSGNTGEPTSPGLPDLGHARYTIQESIGQGGMGEVYRAFDHQLRRTVAIKSIHPRLASKPDLVRRLAREARFAASLDHPFICKVHELIQRDDGTAFLVMEYVEGETLKTLLSRGRLSLEQSIRIAREMAEALAFAHQHGLIHRDIKPSNVIVTTHAHVKVMDFGVAKALDEPEISTTTTLTGTGHVVGTPAYMSPEQARGALVDHRSDMFSFGILLYECLTGELPFQGSTADAYLHDAAYAHSKPLPKHLPHELRALIQRCLQKRPEDRFADFDAIRGLLETAALSLLSASSSLGFSRRVRLGFGAWQTAVILGIAVGAGYLAITWLRRDAPASGQLLVQRPVVTWPSVESGSRVSPDGKVVCFVSNQDGGPRLWIRSIAGSEPRPISDPREAIKTPAWSPDGRQIALLFRQDGRAWLQIVSVWGEPSEPVRPIGDAWDDVALVRWIGTRIYFSTSKGNTSSVLWRRDLATQRDEQITHPADGKRFTVSAGNVGIDVLRDESRIVFAAVRPDTGLWVADLDGKGAGRLPIEAGLLLTPRWTHDGKRVIYVANENGQTDIWEYRLDTKSKAALTTSPLEEESIDVSASGQIIVADTVEQSSHLWVANPDGRSDAVQLTNDSRSDLWPNISTSAGRVIFHRRQPAFVEYTPDDTEIVTARWANRRLTVETAVGPGTGGGLSVDGRRLFFLRWTETSRATPELWVKNLDSPDPGRRLWDRIWFPGNDVDTWAPIGQTVAWAHQGSDQLFFVRRAASVEQVYEIVRASLAQDLTATMQVLAEARGDRRFTDLAVSDDGASLAVVAASRRPYRGGAVQILDSQHPDSSPRVVFESVEGTQLYVRGWTKRGTAVVVKSVPGEGAATEVWEASAQGSPRRVAAVPGLLGMTSRLDAARDRLFATCVDARVRAICQVSLTSGSSKRMMANALEGVTFAGYAITGEGWLVYMRKDTNFDVWVFELADR